MPGCARELPVSLSADLQRELSMQIAHYVFANGYKPYMFAYVRLSVMQLV